MKKTNTNADKPEKIPAKRDRIARSAQPAPTVPKPPKQKPAKAKKTKPAKGATLIDVLALADEQSAEKPTVKGFREIRAASDLAEVNKLCVKTARRLMGAEEELKTERKRCRGEVERCEAELKSAIESDANSSHALDEWRKAVVSAWQDTEEAIAGMDAVVDPLADDVKALRKALREQLANIDQLGLRF